jgi:hypothetical protein
MRRILVLLPRLDLSLPYAARDCTYLAPTVEGCHHRRLLSAHGTFNRAYLSFPLACDHLCFASSLTRIDWGGATRRHTRTERERVSRWPSVYLPAGKSDGYQRLGFPWRRGRSRREVVVHRVQVRVLRSKQLCFRLGGQPVSCCQTIRCQFHLPRPPKFRERILQHVSICAIWHLSNGEPYRFFDHRMLTVSQGLVLG